MKRITLHGVRGAEFITNQSAMIAAGIDELQKHYPNAALKWTRDADAAQNALMTEALPEARRIKTERETPVELPQAERDYIAEINMSIRAGDVPAAVEAYRAAQEGNPPAAKEFLQQATELGKNPDDGLNNEFFSVVRDFVKQAEGETPQELAEEGQTAEVDVDANSDAIRKQISEKTRIIISRPEQNTEIKTILDSFYTEPTGWKNSIITWAKTIIPNEIFDPEGNTVEVTRNSVRSIIAHGKGPLKILTIPDLQRILKNSVLYHAETKTDKQGREERFYNYAHPLKFEDRDYVISISIKEDYNGRRFYDDEFVQEMKKTDGLPGGPVPSTRGKLTHPSTTNILRGILYGNSLMSEEHIAMSGRSIAGFAQDPVKRDILSKIFEDKQDLEDLHALFRTPEIRVVEVDKLEDSKGNKARAAFALDKDGNATIKLTSKADAQSYIHELIHALARTLTDEDLQRWDSLETGVDLRTREGQEGFVDLMMEHLRTKEKTGAEYFDWIIDQIREFIKKIRRALTDANALTPEVREYLDGLLSDPEAEDIAAPAWNDYFQRQNRIEPVSDALIDRIAKQFVDSAPEDELEIWETEGNLAPNGKPSNLTPRAVPNGTNPRI